MAGRDEDIAADATRDPHCKKATCFVSLLKQARPQLVNYPFPGLPRIGECNSYTKTEPRYFQIHFSLWELTVSQPWHAAPLTLQKC